MQAIHKLELEYNDAGGFVVITTCNHKSGRMASLQTKLLPIVIPARGVDGSIWPQDALDAMQEAGCRFCNPIDGPFVHAPANGFGDFMKRGVRASEVSSILRKTLNLEEPSPGCEAEIVSSHGLTATLLACFARYGLSPQTRSMLGKHSSCLDETFAIYSRDLVCAPVSELQGVIDAVHDGFFPLMTRDQAFSRWLQNLGSQHELSRRNRLSLNVAFLCAALSMSPALLT